MAVRGEEDRSSRGSRRSSNPVPSNGIALALLAMTPQAEAEMDKSTADSTPARGTAWMIAWF
jgi:hypothetical protein